MKLTRKDFFRGLALATISAPVVIKALGGGQEATAQGESANIITGKSYKWKMVTTWPPGFPVLQEGCELFAKKVKEMSGGRMDIQVYGGGELVPPLESFNAVGDGAAEIGHGAGYYWAGRLPAAQFFASVPFGMNAQGMNAWIMNGGGQELWNDLYAPYNVIPMPVGNSGVQMGGWFNREINSIEDFKGLKMRMPGLGGKVLQEVGGAAVLVAGSELFTSLERGVIDATEWIGPYHDYLMGFHQIAKYYYAPGWHEAGTVLELIFNKEKFEALPTDLQAIMRNAAYAVNHWVLSEFEAKNSFYLQKIQNETDVEMRSFTPQTLATLRKISENVVSEAANADASSKKVYESFRKFQTETAKWSSYSEELYYRDLQEKEKEL